MKKMENIEKPKHKIGDLVYLATEDNPKIGYIFRIQTDLDWGYCYSVQWSEDDVFTYPGISIDIMKRNLQKLRDSMEQENE